MTADGPADGLPDPTALLALTASEYGFIGEVLHTPAGQPSLKTHAITDIAWNEATRRFYADNAPQGMAFLNLKTPFGHVLTRRAPATPGVDGARA